MEPLDDAMLFEAFEDLVKKGWFVGDDEKGYQMTPEGKQNLEAAALAFKTRCECPAPCNTHCNEREQEYFEKEYFKNADDRLGFYEHEDERTQEIVRQLERTMKTPSVIRDAAFIDSNRVVPAYAVSAFLARFLLARLRNTTAAW